MRLLKINNITVDIDEQTAIGIDIQGYDIKEPSKRFINVSNVFSVPITANNLSIFGLASDVQSKSTLIYQTAICNYWIDNEKYIDNSKVRVESIDDRIHLYVFDKADIWDTLKTIKWSSFVTDFLAWMYTNKSLPIYGHAYTGAVSSFLDSYINPTDGIIMPLLIGNYGKFLDAGQKQSEILLILSGTIGTTGSVNRSFTSALTGTINGSFTVLAGYVAANVGAAYANSCNNDSSLNQYFDFWFDTSTGLVNCQAKTAANTDSTLVFSIGAYDTILSGSSVAGVAGITPGLYGFKDKLNANPNTVTQDAIIYLKWKTFDENTTGGRFSVFVKTIFEYIESVYNVNFYVNDTITGNIWADAVIPTMYVPIRDFDVNVSTGNCYFKIKDSETIFAPHQDTQDKPEKTLYDLVMAFFLHAQIIFDKIEDGNSVNYALRRFDDIKTLAPVINFSGKMSTETPVFKPSIDGFVQNNYIKFGSIYPGGLEITNSKNIVCSNVNLDLKNDLIKIDSYVPGVLPLRSDYVLNCSDKEALGTFSFFVNGNETTNNILINYYDLTSSNVFSWNKKLRIAQLYDIDSEYTFLEEIVQYPKYYEAKMWLSLIDIRNFEFFKQYFIRELNGSFFINKIKGFNPEKSDEPVTVELIKISDRTPDNLN